MTDLRQKLEQLGLLQYLEVFVSEGFDTWETVLDIRESDLDSLNVKLGHRRKLQRAIAETRGVSLERFDRVIPHLHGAPSVDGSYRSDDSASESKSANHKRSEPPTGHAGATTKRKYRRHPKADENAPERPASAYVIFSNQMRESLKGQELSFTEIAKLVGERWQTLSPASRETCERQAAVAKEKYYNELAEYKKTPEHTQYQEYLAEFRAKHNQQATGKRTRLETERSHNARSNSHDTCDKSSRRRVSDAYFQQPSLTHHRSGSSPPPGPRRPGGRMLNSESTSPAAYPFPGVNSPRLGGQYSPMSGSPTSASAFREPELSHPLTSAQLADSRERVQDPVYPSAPGLNYSHSSSSTSLPTASSFYPGQASNERDLPSRRLRRESSSMPSLVHEESTTTNQSSEGGYPTNNSNHSVPYTGPLLPLPDAQKAHRMLPQPIPSTLSVSHSPLDQRPVLPPQPPANFPAVQTPQSDMRQASSLAVLLRAGEMARDRDTDFLGGKENPS